MDQSQAPRGSLTTVNKFERSSYATSKAGWNQPKSAFVTLTVLDNPDVVALRQFYIYPGIIKDIGRSSVGRGSKDRPSPAQDNAFFDSPVISRKHAQLKLNKNSTISIIDVGSLHGTYVNSRKLTPHEWKVLGAGDEIEIGGTVISGSKAFPARKFKFAFSCQQSSTAAAAARAAASHSASFGPNQSTPFIVPDSPSDDEADEPRLVIHYLSDDDLQVVDKASSFHSSSNSKAQDQGSSPQTSKQTLGSPDKRSSQTEKPAKFINLADDDHEEEQEEQDIVDLEAELENQHEEPDLRESSIELVTGPESAVPYDLDDDEEYQHVEDDSASIQDEDDVASLSSHNEVPAAPAQPEAPPSTVHPEIASGTVQAANSSTPLPKELAQSTTDLHGVWYEPSREGYSDTFVNRYGPPPREPLSPNQFYGPVNGIPSPTFRPVLPPLRSFVNHQPSYLGYVDSSMNGFSDRHAMELHNNRHIPTISYIGGRKAEATVPEDLDSATTKAGPAEDIRTEDNAPKGARHDSGAAPENTASKNQATENAVTLTDLLENNLAEPNPNPKKRKIDAISTDSPEASIVPNLSTVPSQTATSPTVLHGGDRDSVLARELRKLRGPPDAIFSLADGERPPKRQRCFNKLPQRKHKSKSKSSYSLSSFALGAVIGGISVMGALITLPDSLF